MKKAHYTALGNVFAHEVENALNHRDLPFQSKAKVYRELEADGMLWRRAVSLGTDRFGAVTVEGWELTDVGRLSYCMECKDEPEDA